MLPRLATLAADQFGVVTLHQVRDAGMTRSELRAALDSGRWLRLARGAYCEAAAFSAADPAQRHRIRGAAQVLALGPNAAAGHTTAALLLGASTLGPPGPVHVVRPAAGRRTSDLWIHRAALPAADLRMVGAIAVTSPARTAVDLARTLPFRPAVVAIDSLLATGALEMGALAALLSEPMLGRGAAAARRALGFADGRSDNPGESISRVACDAAGLPAPELQVWVAERRGADPAIRVDFLWRAQRVVGEFDGAGKLVDRQALLDEKRREDRLRAMGFSVIRWGWDEAYRDFGPVAARLRAALAARAA